MLKTLVTVASLSVACAAVSTVALAGPTHLSDAQYVAAARCQGLIASPALGRGDSAGIDALVSDQGRGRDAAAIDRADEARDAAARQAGRASAYTRSTLIAERNGACQAWAGSPGGTTAAMAGQGAVSN